MNKKPGLLFAVSMLAIIILATAFNLNFGGNEAVRLRAGVNPNSVLYVCPAVDEVWTSFAEAISAGRKYVYIAFGFAAIVILFSWCWGLYQNLIKDKFNADAYKTPWEFTKVFFWAGIICILLATTPNYFRTVHIHAKGHDTEWILCESTSTDARAVNAKAVTLH